MHFNAADFVDTAKCKDTNNVQSHRFSHSACHADTTVHISFTP